MAVGLKGFIPRKGMKPMGVLFFINSVFFVLFNRFYHGLPGGFMDHCPDWVNEEFKMHLFGFLKMLNDPFVAIISWNHTGLPGSDATFRPI